MKPYWASEDGRATLYHGDALELLPTIADGSIDMIFTDPPYGHNNNNNGDLIHRIELAAPKRAKKGREGVLEDARPIANDGVEANELFQQVLPEYVRVLGDCCCCCCCCCGGGGPDPQFARWSLWLDAQPGLHFKQMIVWDKGPMGMGWHYRRSYETVLVAFKGQKSRWYDTTDKVENIVRRFRKIIPSKNDHPTPKPWQLPAFFIDLHTLPGDLILDPFIGGGSTAEACVRNGRRIIGFDVEQQWLDLTINRLEPVLSQGRLAL